MVARSAEDLLVVGRVLVVPDLYHFTILKANVLLGTFAALGWFYMIVLICVYRELVEFHSLTV